MSTLAFFWDARRGSLALMKSTWMSWLQGRSFFFLLAFGWMIPPLIYLFVWSAAAGEGAVGGMTSGEFIAYYLILILVNQVTYATSNWTVGDLIREGGLNAQLLRPISPIFDTLAGELAGKGVFLLFVVPVTAVLAMILQPEINLVPINVLAFVPALVLAWALRFLWGYWLALLAFWTTDFSAMLAVQDALVFLLAGQVAPLSVLPPVLQKLAMVLPFRYMLGFPVEVVTNQLNASDLLLGFAIQLTWVSVALLLSVLLWRDGLKRYEAVGG